MIVNDRIAEKPYTDENDILCWHQDHSQQRTIKGINFVSCLYPNRGVSLPVGFKLVRKTERYIDPKDDSELYLHATLAAYATLWKLHPAQLAA
jgi:hypothetical protein